LNVLEELANAYTSVTDYRTAQKYYQQLLKLAHQMGNRNVEANAHFGIGGMLYRLDDKHEEALENYETAKVIYSEINNKSGEANTLQAIGDVLQFKKRTDDALDSYNQAILIFRAVGDRLGEANTLKAIGDVLQFKKRTDDALDSYNQAILIFRAVGDRLGEANTLKAIGDLQTDDQLAIQEYFQPALKIYATIGDAYSQARILTVSIAPTYLKQNNIVQAKLSYEQALHQWEAIAFEPGIQICQQALNNLQPKPI
jgi:tetratricopeptide (TPR) repeat protein